jgi:Na+-driven multidrug efflux pump
LPFADWYVTRTIWQFGVASAAAAGTYDRIMPFAFGLILALASAVSPIVGQNLGAGAFHRVRLVFTRSLLLTGGYGAVVWLVMFLAAPALAQIFHLDEPASRFFIFLCRYATITWIVIGFMLVANAIFNTLGRAHLAMLFNWGRATLGTMPFVSVGATYGGPEFAMMGLAVSAALFAGGAVLVARRLILQLGHGLTSTAVLSDRDAAVILGPAVGVSADA